MDKWMNKEMDEKNDRFVGMDKWMNEWMDEWTDRRLDGWMSVWHQALRGQWVVAVMKETD